jgi:hypothetical protein
MRQRGAAGEVERYRRTCAQWGFCTNKVAAALLGGAEKRQVKWGHSGDPKDSA